MWLFNVLSDRLPKILSSKVFLGCCIANIPFFIISTIGMFFFPWIMGGAFIFSGVSMWFFYCLWQIERKEEKPKDEK